MTKPKPLIQFARDTVRRNDSLNFPGSQTVQSLKTHYVDLNVSDSQGELSRLSELLKRGSRLILVGDPGSGKTTVLKYLAVRMSEEYIEGTNDVIPIYVPLREMSFSDEQGVFHSMGIAPKDVAGTTVLFLLDGLDELQSEVRINALSMVARLSVQYPNSQIILASRPAGLSPPPPDEFRFYHLESLDSIQTREFISRLADDATQAEAFESLLRDAPFLQGLSQNPLLIHLLWEVFGYQGRLPTVRAELYQTACDFLLSRWDKTKGIIGRQNVLSLSSVHHLLETVAFDGFRASQFQIPFAHIRKSVEEFFESSGLPPDLVDSVIEQLLSSGILIRTSPESISFVHLTFMEFYAARRLVETPRKLASLLVEAGPIAKETILFAAGMVLDVAPLVEAAVDRRELILAANCLREGRTENRVLESYVLEQLQRELGSELIKKLVEGDVQEERPQSANIHSQLRSQLAHVRNSDLTSNQKGKLFEEFAERFFRQTFIVVDMNVNTENGEIDLILENTRTDPFWTEWGGDIFVECKNWNTSRPLKETAVFSRKVRMSRGKLGFFVSVSGFTDDALRTLQNEVADVNAPLIVPITGDAIESMLDHRENFDLFFRESIRKIKHLHKW